MQLQTGGGHTVEVTEPERGQFTDNVGGAIEYRLAHVIYKLLEIMGGGLGSFAGGFLINFLETIEPELVVYMAPLLDEMLALPDLPDGFRVFFERLRNPPDPAAAALLGGLGSQAGGMVMGNVLSALLAPVTFALNRALEPARADAGTAKAFAWRFPHLQGIMVDHLHDQGWSDELIEGYEDILRPRADLGTLLAFYGRQDGTPAGANAELLARGFAQDDIDKFMNLWNIVPGVGDLITMATREAWDETTIERYGYRHDLPGEVIEWAAKQGLSREWVERYWFAHWQLPGVTQSRDMLYRTSFDEDDYRRLLKAADYPSVFRDWMVETAYNPYTRVDIRRMYQIGVLSEAEVLKAHKDIGYDDEKAAALTDFTILEYGEESRDATKSDILHAYELSRFTRDEATTFLVQLGYPSWVADLDLTRIDLQVANKHVTEVVKDTKTTFVNGTIDRVTAYQALSALNLPGSEIEAYLVSWETTRKSKVGRPTKSELRSMYTAGILEEEALRSELSGHRLSERYIEWYVSDTKTAMMEAASKEAERARKEADRIRASELKTDLDVALADINVLIADDKVAIADIKLGLITWVAPEDITEAEREIAQLGQLLFTVPEEERPAIQARIDDLTALIEVLTPAEISRAKELQLAYKLDIAQQERNKRVLRQEHLEAKGV